MPVIGFLNTRSRVLSRTLSRGPRRRAAPARQVSFGDRTQYPALPGGGPPAPGQRRRTARPGDRTRPPGLDSMSGFPHREIDARWQAVWRERAAFATPTDRTRKKYYVL